MRAPVVNRPVRVAVLPALLGAASGLGLWSSMATGAVAAGVAAGLVTGTAAGWAATVATAGRLARRRWLAAVAGTVVAALALAVAPIIATFDLGAPGRVRDVLGTFLAVALPARGLPDLAVVVVAVVTPAVGFAVWAALRSRPLVALIAACSGLAVACVLAGSEQPPWWVALTVALLAGLHLLVVSRTYYTDLPPLIGTATAVRRRLPWWRPALVGLVAVAVAGVAAFLPSRDTVDVRRYVEPDTVVAADQNPLAQAARLLVDPPERALGVDVTVDVIGPSPGRLRLAVLDEYRDEGWIQQASYAVTGEVLPPAPVETNDDGFASDVRVVDGPADSGFRGVPTAGEPREVANPNTVRYSADAGVLLAVAGDEVAYSTRPSAGAAPPDALGPPVGLPASLYECRAGSVTESSARTLTEGTVTSRQRLERIESWLKLTKIYDPEGPGGQTIGSVEQFVGQPYARGNLEVFVSAYALLARCAGVPVRVVVGYPAPPADEATDYEAEHIMAWVETPIEGVGWVALDPVPTPAEQQRQAELAAQDQQPAQQTPDPPPETTEVAPTAPDAGWGWDDTLVLAAIVVAVLMAVAVAAWAVRALVLRRRRRVADPAAATRLAWRSVLEAVRDRGVELGPHLTARETARAAQGRTPGSVSRLMSELAVLADRAHFDAAATTDDDADLAWGIADEVLRRLPSGARVRLDVVRHPGRAWRRWRSTAHEPRRATAWTAGVPSTMLVEGAEGLPSIPGYRLEAKIGDGASAVVYRGVGADGRPVAVKVFHADLVNSDLDRQRFEWEARVAGLVSGQDHLPEVCDAGVTDGGRAYLVSKLYQRGTLLRRVQRAGPLSPGEVEAAGRQLSVALETLHQHGLIHGDVKPENVFVDDDGTLVLGDLGSAWLWADGGPSAAPTPPYAAPEVWLGHAPSIASDLYSLGLTLMFAASGHRPIAGSHPTVAEAREAFGSDVALALLEVDARRRPRRAADAAVLFGADPDASQVIVVRALPTPSFTVRRGSG
ncbi:MAG: protein kinase domain-containing protein [Desertimonas sp.]